MTRRGCSVPGCGGPHYGRGYCRPHHARWRRHGHPQAAVLIGETQSGQSRRSVRRRITAERGPATDHQCAGCGARAVVWSYDGTDADERVERADGHRYSLDPRRYRPRCRSCRHSAAPGRLRPVLNVERAARLYRGGATARGIGALLGRSPSAVLSALRAHGVAIRSPIRARR